MSSPFHVAVGLDGAGWHPAAWRVAGLGPADLYTGQYWLGPVSQLERVGIDAVTFEDAFGLQPGEGTEDPARSGRAVGRLDASLLAAWLAPRTDRIGLIPTITTTHTEPFHTATSIASLDHASHGRAGWRVQISSRPHEAAHLGRRDLTGGDDPDARAAVVTDLLAEAADAIEVARLLWDSWQDDAVIRDVETGRFLDRDRLHRAAFTGQRFSVLGPSITPRSPQGQPVVVSLAHATAPYELAARGADVVLVTPREDADVARIIDEVRAAEDRVGRRGQRLLVWADLNVALGATDAAADARVRELDDLTGESFASDAVLVPGSAATVADRVASWQAAGLDGVRLRPLVTSVDVTGITEDLSPALADRGLRNPAHQAAAGTLRSRLGLGPAANRFTGQPPFTTGTRPVPADGGNVSGRSAS